MREAAFFTFATWVILSFLYPTCWIDPLFQLEFPRKTYLNREVIGTKTEVVSPTERGMLRPEVHFHMLEEVMVLAKKRRICH